MPQGDRSWPPAASSIEAAVIGDVVTPEASKLLISVDETRTDGTGITREGATDSVIFTAGSINGAGASAAVNEVSVLPHSNNKAKGSRVISDSCHEEYIKIECRCLIAFVKRDLG